MCRTSRELGAVESCRRLVRRQSWSLQLDDRRSDEPVDLERGELRSEEHTSELQSQSNLVCRLLLEKKNVFSKSLGKLFEKFAMALKRARYCREKTALARKKWRFPSAKSDALEKKRVSGRRLSFCF